MVRSVPLRILSPTEFTAVVTAPLMTGAWSAVTNLPTLQSNALSIVLPHASQPRFFRLRIE